MAVKVKPYGENGVMNSKLSIYDGDEITLTYTGLLAKSGADKVYAHVGYGKDWDYKSFIPLANEGQIFTCTFKVKLPGDLNICFKDSADNWDNNLLKNYTFKVRKRKKISA